MTGSQSVYVSRLAKWCHWADHVALGALLLQVKHGDLCIDCCATSTRVGLARYRQACTRSAAMPVLFLLMQWSKNGVFALQGRHVRSAPHAKFHVYQGINVRILLQPPKLSSFVILAINLPLRGHLFAKLLRNSQILYACPDGFSVFNLVAFRGQTTKL